MLRELKPVEACFNDLRGRAGRKYQDKPALSVTVEPRTFLLQVRVVKMVHIVAHIPRSVAKPALRGPAYGPKTFRQMLRLTSSPLL